MSAKYQRIFKKRANSLMYKCIGECNKKSRTDECKKQINI